MTGTGKSFLACALAHQACRKGYRALYRRASRLFHELTLARADGSYIRLLAKLARTDVLLIDDFALAPLQDHDRRDLLEILEDRYGTRSIAVLGVPRVAFVDELDSVSPTDLFAVDPAFTRSGMVNALDVPPAPNVSGPEVAV